MIEPSTLERFTVEEVTSVLLEMIEENTTSSRKNTLVADYAFIGVVATAFDRLRKRQQTFSLMSRQDIKARRYFLNLPTGAVANYCGVSPGTYNNFERGAIYAMSFESMWYLWELLYRHNGKPPDDKYLFKKRKLNIKSKWKEKVR